MQFDKAGCGAQALVEPCGLGSENFVVFDQTVLATALFITTLYVS